MKPSVKTVIIGAARARASQIRDEIADLETRRFALETEAGEIEGAIGEAERSLTMTGVDSHPCHCSKLRQSDAQPRDVEYGRRRYMMMAREVDYSGTDRQDERIIRVAEATTDGIVNTTHVAEILIRDGKSTSRKDYLRGTVQNRLSKRSDFEKIAPGTYRFLSWRGDADAGLETESLTLNGRVQLE